MLDDESSLRLKLLRFPPIIGVVYIHAYYTVINTNAGTFGTDKLNAVTEFIRVFISQGVARIAVPLFFLISGYLFFANFRWSQQTFVKKIITRARTLLVPFLFWNLVVLAFYALMQAIPPFRPYFTGSTAVISGLSLFEFFNVILGIKGYPIAYHFWFIRDLMVLIVFSPLIAIILRFAALPFLLVLYATWVTGFWPVLIPDNAGLLFFSAGALCAIKGQNLFAFDRYGRWAFWALIPIFLVDTLWQTAWFNIFWHRTGLIVGVIASLYITKWALPHDTLKRTLLHLGEASFFVYAAHEPLLLVVRILSYKCIPLTMPYTVLVIYLGLPVLVMTLLVYCHGKLSQRFPRFLSLVTGGR